MADAFPMILCSLEHQQASAIYVDKCPRCGRLKPEHRKECVDCAIELELRARTAVRSSGETPLTPQWNCIA